MVLILCAKNHQDLPCIFGLMFGKDFKGKECMCVIRNKAIDGEAQNTQHSKQIPNTFPLIVFYQPNL